MKKVMIASATAFALVASAGMSIAEPSRDSLSGFIQNVRTAAQSYGSKAVTAKHAITELTATAGPTFRVEIDGKHDSYDVGEGEMTTNSGSLQYGANLPLGEVAGGQVFGGLEFGIGSMTSNVGTSWASANISADTYDATISALWVADSLLYFDGQLRYGYFDGQIRPNGGAAADANGSGYEISIEVGKFFTLANDWALIPQVQVMYSDIDMDDAPERVERGWVGSLVDGNTLTARLGLRAERAEKVGVGTPPVQTVFSIINSAGSAQIYAEMIPVAERSDVPILSVVREWRDRVGTVEGATELEFTGSETLAGGFRIRLASKDEDLLRQASAEMKDFLSNIEGVANVRDGLAGGQPELKLRLRPDARHLGFNAEALARQIGYGFGGAEVTKVRRDGSEVRVVVQNARENRDTLADLMQTQLRSASGAWVPLETVAEIEGAYTSGIVDRRDGKRMNIVAASIDRDRVAPEEVGQAVFEQLVPKLRTKYPSVTVLPAGELEEMADISDGLKRALLLAAVLIYVLMAVPLKSYWQPFVILAIVPFGFIAAAVGHLIMDVSLSLFSFFGMLALTGVIVNDSLVMITRYNQAREESQPVTLALKSAGIGRFKAIFLTTATTVIGLLPLLTETSEQAQYLIPAAISLAFGELFGTALMLLLVPVLIAIAEDVLAVFNPHLLLPSEERTKP
ncbi:efflux RND transporter permease subunit [Ruegeria sp. HKCCD6109]|uniref:efflux RND transporter permease subunit n=1 Tax=Ruegeria sp. HKCCD6109 TaxID=2683017 RepID=UPI00149293CB|nr:efflux RND transporter permease subunit [Ruegeria sp. HKCCD6109]NOD65814.1 autotransporter domain-containing protein [Ruegeria sp. HKCCD6109]